MKITTKTGDGGETGLFGGRRVSKGSGWMELIGSLDELQAAVGLCRAGLDGLDSRNDGLDGEVLEKIQDDLYRMMGVVGFEMKCPASIEEIGEEDVRFLEEAALGFEEAIGDLSKFIRPGTTEIAARLNFARAVCRRCERVMVRSGLEMEEIEVPKVMLRYLNRLSDLLFVMGYSVEEAG